MIEQEEKKYIEDKYIYFRNNPKHVAHFHNTASLTDDTIKRVPQCYRYDAQEALKLDNPILNQFIDHCLRDMKDSTNTWKYTPLDTRVHMLKPGMLPCIGGWHCDDFYRDQFGQPVLTDIKVKCPQVHYICTIGETALPEFINSPTTLDIKLATVYKSMNEQVEKNKDNLRIWTPVSGEVIKIGPDDIHRGVLATDSAWRVFMRLTFSNHRFPKNEIRTQTQVYLTNMNGW
jgi:hypothetical protein